MISIEYKLYCIVQRYSEIFQKTWKSWHGGVYPIEIFLHFFERINYSSNSELYSIDHMVSGRLLPGTDCR